MGKIINIWLKTLIFFNLFLFITVFYFSDLKSHIFHIDEYSFLRKSYLFDLFIKKNFNDLRWSSDNFDQPRLGPYIYGFSLHLRGINNIEKFQKRIKFNEIKINNRSWWEELSWEKLSDFPSEVQFGGQPVVQERKVAALFSLGALLILLWLGFISKKIKFAFLAISLLTFNRLMFYYGRLAMTDSFQLFFFFLNLILILYYLKSFFQKNKKSFLVLSFLIGINIALSTGVKVIGILALIFFLGIFSVSFIINQQKKYLETRLILVSLVIVLTSFFVIFVFLNPQIYSQPFNGFIKMFTLRWQSSINYQQTSRKPVKTKIAALSLIINKLLLPGGKFGNFGLIRFMHFNLHILFNGLALLVKNALLRFQKQKEISLEFILASWFGLCFFSLIFYLKNDWPRYYLPLAVAITLIQAYFLAWFTEKGLTFFKRKVFIKFKDKFKVFNTILRS